MTTTRDTLQELTVSFGDGVISVLTVREFVADDGTVEARRILRSRDGALETIEDPAFLGELDALLAKYLTPAVPAALAPASLVAARDARVAAEAAETARLAAEVEERARLLAEDQARQLAADTATADAAAAALVPGIDKP